MTVSMPLLLWLLPFDKLASMLERGRPAFDGDTVPFDDEDLARWVDELLHRLRGPWRHTCLKRSTTLFYLLRSAGRPVSLHIGVRRDDEGAFLAHSWLLRDGALHLEPRGEEPERYSIIARFPDEARPDEAPGP